MTALRAPSIRPTLLTDDRGLRNQAPDGTQPGVQSGPLGRVRLVAALPFNGGPNQLRRGTVFHDAGLSYLADPQNNLVGERANTWVPRLLQATVTIDTRRL